MPYFFGFNLKNGLKCGSQEGKGSHKRRKIVFNELTVNQSL